MLIAILPVPLFLIQPNQWNNKESPNENENILFLCSAVLGGKGLPYSAPQTERGKTALIQHSAAPVRQHARVCCPHLNTETQSRAAAARAPGAASKEQTSSNRTATSPASPGFLGAGFQVPKNTPSPGPGQPRLSGVHLLAGCTETWVHKRPSSGTAR